MVIFTLSTNIVSWSGHEFDSLGKLFDQTQQQATWTKVDSVSRIAWLYNSKLRYDSAIIFYKKALQITPSDVKSNWRANIYLGLGHSYYLLDEWDSALFWDQQAMSIFEDSKDTANIVIARGNLALLYISKGLFEEALSNSFKALSFLGGTPSPSHASCYNSIAMIFKTTKNYPDAEIYFRNSLKLFLQFGKQLEAAKSYNNLGELFILTRQYDSAKHNLLLSAKLKRQLNDTQGLARTLSRLGKVFILTNDLQKAESLLIESLTTQRQINDPVGLIETLNNLGELYLNTSKISKASGFLQEANTIILRYGTPDYLRQNLELRIKLARKQNNFSTGMLLQDELAIIRDSLLNQEKSKSLQAMQIRYETQKKEQEITLLQQRNEISKAKIESNRILIVALVVGLTLVVAIGILIYINLRNARASKKRFELLLQETRHRIKNNLQTLASIFHLQTHHYTDHEMILEARSSESRVHAMSLLHEKFYAGEADHIINTREYIADLINKLVDIYGSHTRNLKVHSHVAEVDLDIDKALALSLIIQELVCNAFKYAFDQEPDPELSVEIREQTGNILAVVADNGIGIVGNRESYSSSQGLSLVDALVSQLDGDMKIETDRGTRFTIRFPGASLWTRPAF